MMKTVSGCPFSQLNCATDATLNFEPACRNRCADKTLMRTWQVLCRLHMNVHQTWNFSVKVDRLVSSYKPFKPFLVLRGEVSEQTETVRSRTLEMMESQI